MSNTIFCRDRVGMAGLAIAGIIVIAATSCGDRPAESGAGAATPPTPGSYLAESSAFSPFYAEELVGRELYLFGRKSTHSAFIAAGRRSMPDAWRTIPGAGPEIKVNGETQRARLMIERAPDQPAMESRLRKTMAKRYGLATGG